MDLSKVVGWIDADGFYYSTWRLVGNNIQVRWTGTWETISGKIIPVYEDENGKPYTK